MLKAMQGIDKSPSSPAKQNDDNCNAAYQNLETKHNKTISN
jgi:hypothetical protein